MYVLVVGAGKVGWNLARELIQKGSEVTVVENDMHRYAVVGKLQAPKSRFPASAVYGASERPVLVLVTCGGSYVPGAGYSDNVIVYARAV